jgi:hypothetical protein
VILDSLDIDPLAFEAQTGWVVKPEGACKGDLCVPLPGVHQESGTLSASVVAERLGMPLVRDARSGVHALGPATTGGRALTTAVAPDLTLPDLEGRVFRVASLRPSKVVLVAWASW